CRSRRSALHERPGIAMAAAIDREAFAAGQRRGALAQRLLLILIQERSDLLRQPRARDAPDVGQHLTRDRLAAEVPDDRAELRLDVEAEAVVDAVDPVRAEQAVAALAIGVVGDEIEETHPLELRPVLGLLPQGEVVLLEIGIDEELEGAFAVRPVALDRERHEPPPERLREMPRRELALVEPARKIPERPFPALGLVDRERLRARKRHLGEEGRVRGPRHAALEGHLAAGED